MTDDDNARFWRFFQECAEGLKVQALHLSLPTEWYTWSLIQRARYLLNCVRHSLSQETFDLDAVNTIALGGLLICENKAIDMQSTVNARIDTLGKLVAAKGNDYNEGGISILEYWILGARSIVHEIHKRTLRLLSLGHSKGTANFEGVAETGLDLAAFSLFLLAYERGRFTPPS